MCVCVLLGEASSPCACTSACVCVCVCVCVCAYVCPCARVLLGEGVAARKSVATAQVHLLLDRYSAGWGVSPPTSMGTPCLGTRPAPHVQALDPLSRSAVSFFD